MAQPTQAAIDLLRKSPDTASQFDEVFGAGASKRYASPAQEEGGILKTAGKVASDIGTGITEAPAAALRGVEGAINETSNAAKSAGDFLNEHVADLGSITVDSKGVRWEHGTPAKNDLQVPKAITPSEPTSTTGHLVEGVTQFTTGMLGAGKFLKGFGLGAGVTTAGKFAHTAATAAIADATVFDPHAARLSNLIEEHPALSNPVSRFLAAKPDDSEALGRFKSTLEGFIPGVAIESFVHGVKAIKLARNGDIHGAADAATEGHAATESPHFPEGDSRNGPAAVTVAPEPVAKAGELPPEGAPKSSEMASSEAAPKTRDTINVADKPLPFRLSPEEVDQYSKNLDARFAVGGEEMANTGQHFNFDKINSSDDIKAAINSMANVVQSKVSSLAKGDEGDTRTWAAVNRNAQTIANIVGGDPKIMVQHLSTLSDNVSHLDSMMKASGDMLVTLSSHSDRLAQMVADEAPGEFGDMKTLLGNYSHSTQLLANTYALLKNVQTNVARAQNAGKIAKQVNPVFKAGAEGIGSEDELMLRTLAKRQAAASRGGDELSNAGSTRKLLEGSMLDKSLAVHNEFWFNAVLSGVKTHVVNTTVNTAKALFMPAEQMVAGVIGRNAPQFLEGAYMYAGMAEQLKSSLVMAQKAFSVADNVLDGDRGAYEGVSKQAITAEMFGATGTGNLEHIINGLGTAVRIPSRLLMAEDEFFKQLTYRSRIYASAMREGVQGGMDAKGVGALVSQRLSEAFDPAGHATTVDEFGKPVANRVRALEQAREATFTQPLDYGMGRWIEEGAQAHPFIRVIMPFVRVPTNIMRDVWQHTPGIGLVQKQLREDLAAGGERANQAWAKQATGTALWTTATMYALEGKMTGYGPVDPQARKAWLLDNQPYSFVSTDPETGKKSFTSFNRLDPYGVPFGLVADFAHISGQLGVQDRDEIAKGMVLALVNNLASKTYLQGLIQAVNVLSDDRSTKLDQWLESRAASYIPNAFSAVNPDPNYHEVRGMLDAMQAKIPGFSNSLPARRDVLGEPMTIPMGYPFDAINPFVMKTTEADPAKMEMARLSSSDAGIRFPMPPPKLNGLDLREVKGEDGVAAYDKWQQAIGEMQIGGMTLHDKLNETVQSAAYQDAADGNAVFKKSRKVDMLMKDFDRYRTRALRETLKDFPEVQSALQDFKRGSKRVRSGQAPGDDPFAVLNQ